MRPRPSLSSPASRRGGWCTSCNGCWDRVSVLSFVLDGFTPQEVGEALDRYGIAVRAGHHCAQPILRRFGHEGTVRASLALYNTRDEVDCVVVALRQIAASRGSGVGGRPWPEGVRHVGAA